MSAENSPADQRRSRGRPFKKGQSGNPTGKPRGARHRTTLAVEALLDGEAEKLTRKAIELALAGDQTALRLCLDRIAPPRRDRLTPFTVPPIRSAEDAITAMGAIVEAVAKGRLTTAEAANVSRLVETYVSTMEALDHEARLARIEKHIEARRR